jgi:hypothetical protein
VYLTNNEFLELLKLKSEYDKDRGTWEKSREGEEYGGNNIFDKVKSIIEESMPTSSEQGDD